MATKKINSVKLTDTLTLTECKDGYWLYDYTRGMNLAMKSKTASDAFVKAITYYQKRTKKLESDLKKYEEATDLFFNTLSENIEE